MTDKFVSYNIKMNYLHISAKNLITLSSLSSSGATIEYLGDLSQRIEFLDVEKSISTENTNLLSFPKLFNLMCM